MNRIYLEYHDDLENKHRFYQLFVLPTLFDYWSLVREWGRIGSSGTVKKDWFKASVSRKRSVEKLDIKTILQA